jgi:hypothetical protein
MALYAPVSRGSGTLVAENRPASAPRRNVSPAVERAQSPDHEDAPRGGTDSDLVMVPSPKFLGIEPVADARELTARAASGTTRRTAWQPHPVPDTHGSSATKAQPTDLNLDPAADHDHFGPPSGSQNSQADAEQNDAAPAERPATAAGSRWRPVKPKAAGEVPFAGK